MLQASIERNSFIDNQATKSVLETLRHFIGEEPGSQGDRESFSMREVFTEKNTFRRFNFYQLHLSEDRFARLLESSELAIVQ